MLLFEIWSRIEAYSEIVIRAYLLQEESVLAVVTEYYS